MDVWFNEQSRGTQGRRLELGQTSEYTVALSVISGASISRFTEFSSQAATVVTSVVRLLP